MKSRYDSHLFWGAYSPLSVFSSAALIILASGRFSSALICSSAIIWVYGLSAIIFSSARPILPAHGKMTILLFLSSFLCGIFMLLISLINPLLILGTAFFIILVPACCLGSGFFEASWDVEPVEVFSQALVESVVLCLIILAISLIREPLGLGTLSFPGSAQGIVELFSKGNEESFVPLRLLSVSSGGLLLLGYAIALFRYFRERTGGIQEDER